MKPQEAASKSIGDLLKELSAEPKGLSSSEALSRRQQYGPNEIAERKVNPFLKFLAYFWGPIPWMIEIAAVLSAVLGRWDMTAVLGMATFLGAVGTVSSFLLLFIGVDLLHLTRDVLQSMMYLKLSVAGHFLIFITRTRGHFWSYRPSNVLLGAVLGTQAVATAIAVFGILIAPIGWQLALVVWVYAMAFFLLTDAAKVRLYKAFDRKLRMLEREAVRIEEHI
jgi:magnesium-transporting ATPase (P-type)